METQPYRQRLEARMSDIAERLVATEGLSSVQARRVAQEADCSVGTLYNVFGGLDGLLIAVNRRTLDALGAKLTTVARSFEGRPLGERLLALALSYRDFAFEQTPRWRALFEHRMEPGRPVPQQYIDDQSKLFGLIEACLTDARTAQPLQASAARALFSAVHGIVVLALDNKLGGQTPEETDRQIRFLIGVIGRGLDQAATSENG